MRNLAIKKLNFTNCSLDDESIAELAKSLAVLTKLKHLYLSNNNIDSKGLDILLKALLKSNLLETLIISNNLYAKNEESIILIANFLLNNTSLTSLAIGHHPIIEIEEDEEAEMENSRITVPEKGIVALASALKDNKTLKSIYIYTAEISNASLKAIIAMLEVNTTLTEIDFGNKCQLDPSTDAASIAKFYEYIKQNQINLGPNHTIPSISTFLLLKINNLLSRNQRLSNYLTLKIKAPHRTAQSGIISRNFLNKQCQLPKMLLPIPTEEHFQQLQENLRCFFALLKEVVDWKPLFAKLLINAEVSRNNISAQILLGIYVLLKGSDKIKQLGHDPIILYYASKVFGLTNEECSRLIRFDASIEMRIIQFKQAYENNHDLAAYTEDHCLKLLAQILPATEIENVKNKLKEWHNHLEPVSPECGI